MGYCEREYVEYMKINCPKSCKICGGDGGSGGLGQCGFKPIAPIVGGTEAPEGAWPWQAQIRTPTGFTFCGGTLVHPRRVVTAAHCTKPETDGSVSESGYGRLASNGNMPKSLMQVMVPVVSQSRCKNFYGSSIHDSMICAGLDAGGKDSCQGDSGGPMVCEYNGKYFLEGVVPWGHECADPRKYGVYARVRYLSQWVNQMMNSY